MAALLGILHQTFSQGNARSNTSTPIQESRLKRIALASLPIIDALGFLKIPFKGHFYQPSTQSTYQVYSAAYDAYQSFSFSQPTHSAQKIFLAIFEALHASYRFFQYRALKFFFQGADILESSLACYQAFLHGNMSEIFSSIFALSSTVICTTSTYYFTLELLGLCCAINVLAFALNSRKEFQKGNNIEAASKLLMMAINVYKGLLALKDIYIRNPQIAKIGETIARICHRIDSFLAYPFWLWTEKAFRVFTPIRSDNPEQFKNCYVEFLARSLYWIISPILLPIFLSTSLLELFPRILANAIQPEPFFSLKGQGTPILNSNKTSVMTWNVCFVAGGFPRFYAGIPPWRARIDSVLKKIREENPDILTLQEVNDLDAAYALYNGLKDLYCDFYFNMGSKVLAQNSGLFVATKVKSISPRFEPFNTATGSQKFVNKGFFSLKFPYKFLFLVTTHLSPSKDDANPTSIEQEKRKTELSKTETRIKDHLASTTIESIKKQKVVLLAGDMNLSRGSSEWSSSFLNQSFNTNSLPKESEPTCATDYLITQYKGKTPPPTMKPFQCDYALLYDPNKNQNDWEISSRVVRAFDLSQPAFLALSDHHALRMDLDKPKS